MLRSKHLICLPFLISCQEVSPTGVSDERPRGSDTDAIDDSIGNQDPPGARGEPSSRDDELPEQSCSADGGRLLTLVNLYRAENGRPTLPQSDKLCLVAEAHVGDLMSEQPYSDKGCGAPSWSTEGPWEGCCYLEDNSNPECMWDKPDELTGYGRLGYEAVAINVLGISDALAYWKEDAGLNEMILGDGQWAGTPWGAIGAAYVDGHASLWLAEAPEQD